jgi:hypothetical protein
VSEDTEIVPSRTVATSALAVRRSNYSARSHPLEITTLFPLSRSSKMEFDGILNRLFSLLRY